MWTSKLFWKLFAIYTAFSLTLAIGFLWIASDRQRAFQLEQAQRYLEAMAETAAADSAISSESDLPPVSQRYREISGDKISVAITLCDAEGKAIDQASDLSTETLPEVQAAVQGERRSGMRLGRDRRPLLHAAVPIRRGERILGVVLATDDLTRLQGGINRLAADTWLFACGSTIAAVSLTFLVLRGILKPLTSLTAGAKQITESENTLSTLFSEHDEFGLLDAAFSQMRRSLEGRMIELKENTERLETVLGSMVEGVIAVSPEERVLLANEAGRRLLEMPGNAVGRPLLEATRILAVHRAVLDALAGDEAVKAEFPSHGTIRRNLALRATRLPGTPSPGVMVVLHDVTELRRLENLRQEFVANVSHELKTPLASIKAYAETLRLGAINDSENCQAFLTRIEEQAERLHELILDMLQIARVEAGEATFEITAVNLAQVVRETLQAYVTQAESKSIALRAETIPPDLRVSGDEEGIRTILRNLIDNAIKYTPDGGTVTVSVQQGENIVSCEVRDTGIGIAAKDQPRLFERFYRVDKARSREVGGTGLGLAIVKHFAQAFGGVVEVESELGKGSRFRVKLRPA